MITLTINGIPATVEPGTTLLEAARYLGIEIPTLCHMEGLTPYGACRLCVVEIGG
ncbi:MAG TPA: 2Fe-2S iron-sulfur cluster-binding protein, partial [Bryobacteraceae bacterium]|nr:2Fe-2S iron-sulfur cluster-binding protein [Bryobacteraceae bacterium]